MSWIQSFFERFKKEEATEQRELHNTTRFVAEKKQSGFKDMEARISYQYPKGHFRFPIIPDEKKPINPGGKPVHQIKQPKDRIHSDQSHEVKHKKEMYRPKKELPPRIYSSGPFRPTEIPSPIFGFNRPKETVGTVIEYELSHFLTNRMDENKDIAGNNKTYADRSGLSKASEPVEMIDAKTEETAQTSSKDFRESNYEQAAEIPPKMEDKQDVQNQPVLISLVMEDEKESGQLIDSSVVSDKDEETAEVESHQAEVEMALVESAAAIAAEEPLIEDSDFADEIGTSSIMNQTERAEPEITQSSTEADPERPEAEKPKRAHLPFNVMMLKQDRQKWEEMKPQRTEKQSKPIQPQPDREEPVNTPATAIESSIEIYQDPEISGYEFPSLKLLNPPVVEEMDNEWLSEQENLLNQTLENFNVGAKVVNLTQGPAVTRFEVQPEPGVKVNKVTNLTDDIKLSLAARDIRIEAPIPGKHTIGIEVPNQKSRPVQISEIIQSSVFLESASPLTAVLGLDISGKPIVTDLKKMPHGLIAGATGSGKSVCINSILVSLLYKASPEDLKLLLIDPKMVELAPYNRIPHLVSPVITDVKAATAALKWAVDEMERRYELFAHTGVRDINKFNVLAMQHKQYSDKLPFVVIIIDELADLMMMSPADVEEAICRIAQKARACGIHLIIATQRPSVDVITGLIKANIPTRIAFSVSSQVDSRTIIDIGGAEKLLGRGDMLFLENGSSKPVRLQGTFVSDEEIDLVVAHVREQREPDYLFEQEELLKKAQTTEEEDELFYEACEFVVDQASASTSSLQRHFKIGYNRAARLMEMMEQQGYISSAKGSKPRDVFLTAADLDSIQAAGLSDLK